MTTRDGTVQGIFADASNVNQPRLRRVALHGLTGKKSCGMTSLGESLWRVSVATDGFSDWYILNFQQKQIQDGYIMSNRRDRRTGRIGFANRVCVGLNFGFESMVADADDMMGGRHWALAGMEPSTETARTQLSEDIMARIDIIKDVIDPDVLDDLRELAKLDNPDDLRKIALQSEVIDIDPDAFERAQAATTQNGICDYPFSSYVEAGFFTSNALRIGDVLTCGLKYPCILNFDDAGQMGVFENFTGVPVRRLTMMRQAAEKLTQPMQSEARSSNPASRTAHRP